MWFAGRASEPFELVSGWVDLEADFGNSEHIRPLNMNLTLEREGEASIQEKSLGLLWEVAQDSETYLVATLGLEWGRTDFELKKR